MSKCESFSPSMAAAISSRCDGVTPRVTVRVPQAEHHHTKNGPGDPSAGPTSSRSSGMKYHSLRSHTVCHACRSAVLEQLQRLPMRSPRARRRHRPPLKPEPLRNPPRSKEHRHHSHSRIPIHRLLRPHHHRRSTTSHTNPPRHPRTPRHHQPRPPTRPRMQSHLTTTTLRHIHHSTRTIRHIQSKRPQPARSRRIQTSPTPSFAMSQGSDHYDSHPSIITVLYKQFHTTRCSHYSRGIC